MISGSLEVHAGHGVNQSPASAPRRRVVCIGAGELGSTSFCDSQCCFKHSEKLLLLPNDRSFRVQFLFECKTRSWIREPQQTIPASQLDEINLDFALVQHTLILHESRRIATGDKKGNVLICRRKETAMNGEDIKILLSIWATILIMGAVLFLLLKLAN
jgi:hypothetical protein